MTSLSMQRVEDTKRAGLEGGASADSLSNLFRSVVIICQEQFPMICAIFDEFPAVRISKNLISAFFEDSQFGLLHKMETILDPPPPEAPLSPSEYLDIMHIIREKLNGLYFVVDDCCKVGADDSTGSMGKEEVEIGWTENSYKELRTCVENHVSQVLVNYMPSYFRTEMANLREVYRSSLFAAVGDWQLLVRDGKGEEESIRLNTTKFKSFKVLTDTVVNSQFMARTLTLSGETVTRMVSIGRDDPKLTWHIRDVYFWLLQHLMGCILRPAVGACKNAIKCSSSGYSSGHITSRDSDLPYHNFFSFLAAFCEAVTTAKDRLEATFSEPLLGAPNLLTACRERLRNALKVL